jgi:D-alanyl-D-alanine endopeptidase (penicillin-binding protein 7)
MVQQVKNEHINIFLVYGLSVFFIVTFSLVHKVIHFLAKKNTVTPTIVQKKEQSVSKEIFNKNIFQNVQIEGKAYVIYDLLNHEIIASHNETALLPLASLTKVMTAVSSTLHKSKEEKITITQKSIDGGYDLGLKKNQVWSLGELLKYTLVFSSNDGAESVANSFGSIDIFLQQMNTDAKNLGLNLFFTNPAGLDINGKIGGKGDAVDMAKLLGVARMQIPEILDATTKKRQTVTASGGKISGIPNTNQAIETLPGAEASKTGFTDLAGGNLGIIVDISIGHPVAIVVLGSTREGRFRDVELLYTTLERSLRSSQ